mmetsp:Transcript_25997/g.32415  ORF Transcript_25997/g.32415 Transcript_25997/m.32415 type:complete len:160 (+) Transcript_25997:827-1306(+)|eukprot:CAMPEP_0170457906 /NCGR_PEP_ID=MMETSP0123-20130129/5041_1 /TAXON_ID=182087 /ORGANISM="Favella ehrenbergii, Strain Fehren 1" /LENGTH=159 /DNA_ID=CAMNT_0010721853 /DNA_START=799 /DNA_END=1278 /DNA_ORIENTATION=-
MNYEARTDYVNFHVRTHVELNDHYMSIGSIGKETYSGFVKEVQQTRTLPYANTFWNAITYEVSLTQKRYFRTVFSLLEFFSAMGGLFAAFARICLLIITGVNYFGSYQFVMAETFYSRRTLRGISPFAYGSEQKMDSRNDVQWNSMKAMMLNIRTFLPP